MNRVNLELLDKQSELLDERQEYLKQYELDEESIKEFRSGIKKVSKEEADRLGEKVQNTIYYLIRQNNFRNFNTGQRDLYLCSKISPFILDGANVNYCSPLKTNYLLLDFIDKEYFDCVILLLKAGADINVANAYDGNTPLKMVASAGDDELLKILILLGADINYKDKNNNDALHYAKFYKHKECIKIIKETMQGKNIIIEEDINHNKKSPKALSELTPEELLQEAQDRLNEVLSNTLVRKRSR